MSSEREKILRMVAEGTVTPEDAERLLGRLDPAARTTDNGEPVRGSSTSKSGPFRYLRVVVDGKDKANIRVPIGLIRTGIKLTALMPLSASKHLSDRGIDLSQFNNLDSDELMEALAELQVDVSSGDGDTVRVFCE
jgi:hypothetical protein